MRICRLPSGDVTITLDPRRARLLLAFVRRYEKGESFFTRYLARALRG